jgi:glycosidase
MPYDRKDPHAWHGGDLEGVRQHLDYLKDLGISTVWLTPIQENREPDSYHGYGATDSYRVDPHFGNLEDLKALADALHRQGMKLVLDTVPNHVGPAHPWADDSPTPDWFHGSKASHLPASGVFPALMDPHASEREVREVQDGWFVDLLPDLNQENSLVSTYLIQNAMWWIEETSADGLRLDTFPYVKRKFWRDFHQQLFREYPKLTTVGEVLNETYILPPAVNAFLPEGATLARKNRSTRASTRHSTTLFTGSSAMFSFATLQ